MSDWEIGDYVWCYRKYLNLLPYRNYKIVGSGDLSMNADPNVSGKKGYGYCVEREFLNGVKATREFVYFTEYEMDKYFVKSYNDIKSAVRDNKIDNILDDNN